MTNRLVLTTVLSALLTLAIYYVFATIRNGGIIEHAIDDVYIHLAMAEQIFAGGYGVNAVEYSSASSSPLYPYLLPTWFGPEVQRWLPLFWNVVALSSAAALVGIVLDKAKLGPSGYVIAILAPFTLWMHVTAFTGMENMALSAAALAIVLGLWRYAETREIGWLLIIGVFLAPAFRLEGLALALAAGGVVFVTGHRLIGLGLGALALLPVLIFVAYLTSLGLDPLPNSVNSKLDVIKDQEVGFLAESLGNLQVNLGKEAGKYMAGMAVLILVLAGVAFRKGLTVQALVAAAVVAATLAHLCFGRIGFMGRYENYLVLSLFATLTLLVSGAATKTKPLLLALALVGGVLTYGQHTDNYISNPRAIYAQQGQMSRFAKEFVQAPVAVNDLGYVAWQNPNHVLDLWGLASAKALKIRKSDPAPGWADELADEKGVRVAMVYPHWLPDAFGSDWVLMGGLALVDHGEPFLGGQGVFFYARNQDEADALEAPLAEWIDGLPDGALFIFPDADPESEQ